MTEVAEPVKDSSQNPTQFAPPDEPLNVPMWLWIAVGLCAVLSLALTVQNGFIYSDHELIASNSMLWNGYGLQLIWTSIFPSPAAYQFDYYAPVSWSLLSFEWRAFGSWAGGYHAVSLILHVMTSLMMVQLLRKLAVAGAGLVGLLFAAHPVLLGATGWLTMQPLVLGTMFSLAALYVMVRWMGLTKPTNDALPTESNRLFILMILLVVIASLAHPIGGLVPIAALIISWWKRGTVDSQQMSSLAPLVLVGVAAMALFLYMQSKLLSSATLAELDFGTTPLAELFARLQIVGFSMLFHAVKLIVPYPLSFDYGWTSPGIMTLVSLGIVVVVVGILISQSQKMGRGILAAAGLYALFLLPFLGIFNIERMRYSFVRDGEVYAAAIPLIALVVVVLIRLLKSEKSVTPIVAVASLVFVALSVVRAGEFKNNDTLWNKTLARNPNSLLVELDLARTALANGDKSFREHLDRALEINPKNLDARTMDALTAPDLASAIEKLQKLLNQYPAYGKIDFETAKMFERVATRYEEAGKSKDGTTAISQAFEFYTNTLKNDPRNIAARVKVGQLLVRAGLSTPDPQSALDKKQQGIFVLQQAVDMNPNRIETRLVFAKALFDVGMAASPADRDAIFARASENLFVVNSFDPNNADAAYYAGLMHQQSTFTEQALIAFRKANEKRPEWTAPMFGIAEVYLKRDEFDKAREWIDKALKIEPDNKFFKLLSEKIETAATQPTILHPTTSPTTRESSP